VLRPWPWILTALCSILVYPQLSDIQAAFPKLDPSLLGHDIAFPAMLKFLPVGFVGLMVGGLVAANSSTILTHLNWGASYLVHDFYQRFIKKTPSEKHYVMVGRLATILLFVLSSATVYLLDTAKDAFDVILQIGAGTGLLYLVRWFWWRVNAWCEVVAMASSFLVSLALLVLAKNGVHFSTHMALIVTIAVTTLSWVTTAYLGPETDRKVLVEFYKKVRPFGPGWTAVRQQAGLGDDPARTAGDNIPLALLGWVADAPPSGPRSSRSATSSTAVAARRSHASPCSWSREERSCAWSAGCGRRPRAQASAALEWPPEAAR
jgi:Na+/proline symporter